MTNEEVKSTIAVFTRRQALSSLDMERMKFHLEEMRKQQAVSQRKLNHATRLMAILTERPLSTSDKDAHKG
jgi:hypothetical protein